MCCKENKKSEWQNTSGLQGTHEEMMTRRKTVILPRISSSDSTYRPEDSARPSWPGSQAEHVAPLLAIARLGSPAERRIYLNDVHAYRTVTQRLLGILGIWQR